jgi:hypothetical protein
MLFLFVTSQTGSSPVHCGNREETTRRILTNAGLTASLSEVKESTLRPAVHRPADADIEKLARMIEAANTVAIFGGDGCRDARYPCQGQHREKLGYA